MSAHNSHQDAESVNQRLVDQYTEIARLAGGLAHEIKNPLSTIRLNVELLGEEFGDENSPSAQRALKKLAVVQQECQRLQDLLDDFLNFAKVRHFKLCPTNLNDVIGRVLSFFAPKAKESGIEVIEYLDGDLPTVMLDPEVFHGALLNLVINAQQAMSGGGQLVVRTFNTADGVALRLIDTGCGMDKKTLLHIFDAFFSTKSGGSGLGLPTVKKIIETHNGAILVQSEPGYGTQFTIKLPVPARISAESNEP